MVLNKMKFKQKDEEEMEVIVMEGVFKGWVS